MDPDSRGLAGISADSGRRLRSLPNQQGGLFRQPGGHVHPEPASLDYHMDVAGPRFGRFADLVTLSSIHIYGRPRGKALGQLHDKAGLLGHGGVIVQDVLAGSSRFEAR